MATADANFIAHARTDVPALCDEVERLSVRCAALDAELRRVTDEREDFRTRWTKASAETREVREHVRQLEEMLPDDLRVCFSCKEGGASPEGYVVAAKQTVRDEDGNLWCEECAAEAEYEDGSSVTAELKMPNP